MTDLHTDVERYLRYLSVERQLSPITLLNYQRQLEAIINFASENGLLSWQQCDVTMVRNFAVRSRRKGLGAASLALRLSALRSFFDWLVSQNERRYGFLRYVAFLTGWSARMNSKLTRRKVFRHRKRRVICRKTSTSMI